MKSLAALLCVVAGVAGLAGCSSRPDLLGDRWVGPAIAYSGYRAGQSPKDGTVPALAQVEEDLRLLARHWRLIRIYAADRHGEDVLEVIRRERLDLHVMLGIWLDREPGKERENAEQIADGIRLANEYDDIVVAVNVGNEVLIEWTEHPVREERVIEYVREVKAAVPQPVTVADNYVWWRDFGEALAREVDFITIHTYPIWERKEIDEGLAYTVANYEQVRAAHPGREVVIGEAGWATYTVGNLHVPRAGDEQKQRRYHEELTAWARENRVTLFFFEAFDEPWKPAGTEQHWGLFSANREAKPAIRHLFPDRLPQGPTSPAYPDRIEAVGPEIGVVWRATPAAAPPSGTVNPLGPGLSASEVVTNDRTDGGAALRLAFNGENWGGVYCTLEPYDASGATSLALRLRHPDAVAWLELKLEGPATNARSVNLIEYAAGGDASGWREFRVPLEALDGVDLSRVAVLGLWNPKDASGEFVAGDLLVDAIRFE